MPPARGLNMGMKRRQSSSSRLISGSEGGHISRLFDPHAGDSIGPADYQALLSRSQQTDFGKPAIYIHLPFCASRCLSCDNVTTVTHDVAVIDEYLDYLEQEFELVTGHTGSGMEISQLYLGGGTPNYLSDPQLLRLADIIERHFQATDATDAVIELSPKRSSVAQLQLLRGLGFRSIKFEVRDLDPEVQKALGRMDSLAVLEDVFANARRAGFEHIGMDLVYGLPSQTSASIAKTVEGVLQLDPDRLNCYAFTRQPDTFGHQRAIQAPSLPSLADRLIMFNGIVDAMESSGYLWVGLDSFVRPGDPLAEAQGSRRLKHNWMGYHSHGSDQLLGFGASAISEVAGACVQNHIDVDAWSKAIDEGVVPVRAGVQLSESGQAHRTALSGLFSNMEVSASMVPGEGRHVWQELHEQGYLYRDGDRLSITEQGRYLLHHICGNSALDQRWASGW